MAADRPSRRRVSLAQLLLLLPIVVLVVDSFDRIADNSYLWHITAGHLQRDAGEVLTSDPFSFTMAGEPWLTQSWLAELLYSVAESWLGIGFTGMMLFIAGLVTLVGVGVYVFTRSMSLPATAVIVVLTSLLFVTFHVPRPVLFSYPLFVLVVLAWDRPELRWGVPFLMWTWASVHGSFAIGLAYIGLRLLWERNWGAWPHLLAGGVATLLTAHGLGVVTILTDFAVARPYLALITEWRTPDFLSVELAPFLVGVILIIYGSMKGRLGPPALWVVVPFLLVAMSATRSVATAWIGLLPALALSLEGVEWRFGRGFPRHIAAVAALAIIALPFFFIEQVALDEERFPIAAASALEDIRTFHDDVAGGYLTYAGALSDGVFIDDRAELFGPRIREFIEVRSGRSGWEELFERDGIEQVLLRVGEPVVRSLRESGWEPAFEDEFFIVLRRS